MSKPVLVQIAEENCRIITERGERIAQLEKQIKDREELLKRLVKSWRDAVKEGILLDLQEEKAIESCADELEEVLKT